jgi:hypothetical protein
MCRTLEFLLPGTIRLAIPGFKLTGENTMELAKALNALKLGKKDALVTELLSTSTIWAPTVTASTPPP